MKIVSYEIARVLKKAGYPQRFVTSYGWYDKNGRFNDSSCDVPMDEEYDECVAPTYMEVWLWLWKEKKICINCNLDKYNLLHMWWCTNEDGINYNTPNFNSPEEAIISAIEYLVENNLIK